jgi:TolB-like protein
VKLGATVIAFAFISVCPAQQSVDLGVSDLASKMGKVLVGKSKTKLAVSDFADLEGRPTEFGRFVAEQLSVEFVNTQGISVVDRANLKSILAEHKLSEDGLINPDTAKKLGQFAGVDVIVIGTITQLDDSFVVTAKAIATDTAEIVAAAKATMVRTKDSQQLVSHEVGSSTQLSSPPNKPQHTVVATKDLGDLRFSILKIQRATVNIQHYPRDGVRCILEVTNRNIREPLTFALNGQKRYSDSPETTARSKIIDGAGKSWIYMELQGISIVRVGGDASPSTIAATVAYGQKGDPRQRYATPGARTWLGDFTTIPAGETIQASITFQQEHPELNRPAENDLQLECEVVAGVGAQALKTLRLYNMLFSDLKLDGG